MSADINFDDEDESNLHAHARKNAKEAIALARARAAQFDTEASLERKTNEAIALAKAQAHLRDEDDAEHSDKPSGTLVDRTLSRFCHPLIVILSPLQSIRTNSISKTQHPCLARLPLDSPRCFKPPSRSTN